MIDFQPRGSSLAISNANRQKGQSIQNLSSGRRENIRLKDPGSFSMNVRLQGNVTMENRLAQNMQGLISYGQLQDGVLENMGQLVSRMTELASLSTDTMQSSEDRASYQREFLGLVDQFESLQTDSFNGVKLFGNGYGEKELYEKIVHEGMTDEIKHMTMWTRDQFQDPSKTAATSGINARFGAHAAIGFIGNDNFPSDFTGVSGAQSFVTNLQTSGAHTNVDTGSIAGSDVSGNPADEKTAHSVVPDASGSPQGKYLEDETGEAPTFSYSGSGGTSTLTPIPQITFGDTSTYNLLSISSATQTLDYPGALSKTISGSRAIVGSNMSIIENGLDSLRTRTNSLGQSISRIQDTSFSEESTSMAKATIRLNFSLSMMTQANQTSSSVVTALLS